MIADLAGIIGGDRVAVTGLMGPGVDPHLYRPSAGDVRALEEADVIFYGGLELEGRMIQLFEKMARSGKPTFAVSEDIDRSRLRQPVELEGRYDPHIWFDVTLWQEAARTVNRRLAELDPASRDTFQAHTDAYLAELAALHAEVQEKVATLPPESRVLVTAHDAFGYLGRQYGMEVRGLQGTSTATEAGVADVQRLADEIVRRKIKAIFIESSVPQATIEAVRRAAAAQGWDVQIGGQLYSDAMGTAGTPDGTYLGMVRHNVDTIVGALR
jgi:manganese/zinc/iron transport system substrate-binding protein